jgi:hypothetical protein
MTTEYNTDQIQNLKKAELAITKHLDNYSEDAKYNDLLQKYYNLQ